MGRSVKLVLLLLALYAGSYIAFRQTSQEVWPKDKQTYVIFPTGAVGRALYYVWRPLSYADGALTGMRFHVGPHSQRLSMISGVAQVNIQGAQKRAVRIKFDLDALAARGMSVEEIMQAVTAQASVSPVGSIRTQHQLYILEVQGTESTAAFFRPLVVAWRNGAPVRIQDIAKVEDSVENEEAR